MVIVHTAPFQTGAFHFTFIGHSIPQQFIIPVSDSNTSLHLLVPVSFCISFLYAAFKTTAFKMSFVVQKCTRTKLTTVQQRGQNHQSKPRPSNSNKANRNQSTQVPSDCRKHTTQHYLILFCNLSQLRQYALLYLHKKVLYLN